jgi:hypothetical protein
LKDKNGKGPPTLVADTGRRCGPRAGPGVMW